MRHQLCKALRYQLLFYDGEAELFRCCAVHVDRETGSGCLSSMLQANLVPASWLGYNNNI